MSGVPTAARFIKAIRTACTRELGALGFQREGDRIYTVQLTPGFQGWLGLNEAIHRGDGSAELSPVVGVTCEEIERAVAGLSGHNLPRYPPATISMNVGYVMPQAS